MDKIEILGLVATLLVLVSYMWSKLKVLRYINIVGSILFVIYGLMIDSYSVWILNGGCILVHIYKLIYDERPVKKYIGCIIVGYPGIGKSSLSISDDRYIDLESSLFKVNGRRSKTWYEVYCHQAVDLALQGYRVFVSAHADVQLYLAYMNIPENIKIYSCHPSLGLKDLWMKRLLDRYHDTKSEKDFAAMEYCRVHYDAGIRSMMRAPFEQITIDSYNYNLKSLLDTKIKTVVWR